MDVSDLTELDRLEYSVLVPTHIFKLDWVFPITILAKTLPARRAGEPLESIVKLYPERLEGEYSNGVSSVIGFSVVAIFIEFLMFRYLNISVSKRMLNYPTI